MSLIGGFSYWLVGLVVHYSGRVMGGGRGWSNACIDWFEPFIHAAAFHLSAKQTQGIPSSANSQYGVSNCSCLVSKRRKYEPRRQHQRNRDRVNARKMAEYDNTINNWLVVREYINEITNHSCQHEIEGMKGNKSAYRSTYLHACYWKTKQFESVAIRMDTSWQIRVQYCFEPIFSGIIG